MLKFENVTYKAPDDGTVILSDLSFEVEDGEILVLTGPNGGGKSTAARLAMGIIKPTSGRILLDGTDISDMDITERSRLGVGYAFQAPARFKGLTVRRLMALAAGGSIEDDECCKYLSRVGLCAADYLDRALDATLSGGELKRIEVATVMARKLSVAIYDEPEAGIDIWSFNMLVNAFTTLGKERSGSLMIISHQERVMQTADRIAVIAEGKIRDIGTKEKVLPGLTDLFRRECIKNVKN